MLFVILVIGSCLPKQLNRISRLWPCTYLTGTL